MSDELTQDERQAEVAYARRAKKVGVARPEYVSARRGSVQLRARIDNWSARALTAVLQSIDAATIAVWGD